MFRLNLHRHTHTERDRQTDRQTERLVGLTHEKYSQVSSHVTVVDLFSVLFALVEFSIKILSLQGAALLKS